MVMVRFVRVCLAALSMCHPQVIVSRQLIRHDGGNILKYQDNRAGLQRLPLNPMECGIFCRAHVSTSIKFPKTLTLFMAKTRSKPPRLTSAGQSSMTRLSHTASWKPFGTTPNTVGFQSTQ